MKSLVMEKPTLLSATDLISTHLIKKELKAKLKDTNCIHV